MAAPSDYSITLEFGAGINSSFNEEKINVVECASGKNFDLDTKSGEFRNRKPFDLVGTTPNAAEIRGFATLIKADGTVAFLVQSGDTVYDWDGVSTYTSKGTVSATAKLRGRLSHNWQLSNKVIITDLNLQQPVMEYDGTTLQNVTFTINGGSAPWVGTFKSKYCFVANERTVYANVEDNGVLFPHLFIGSQTSDYTIISNNQSPSTALNEADPFFLVQPDLRRINGVVEAFGTVVTSSYRGSIFTLTGSSAKDYAFNELYPLSGADGDESLVYSGNDILYGKQGVIESLIATDQFGDVETNDLSSVIDDIIEDYGDWTSVYNQRNQRVYFIPSGESEAWVYYKKLEGTGVSQWSLWDTEHAVAFQPTAIMNMYDPADGLEYVFFGDSSGNVYRMEGSGASGDGGTTPIQTTRTSKSFFAPLDQEVYQIDGFVEYRGGAEVVLTITIEYSGMNVFDESITVTLPANMSRVVYGSGFYYKNSNYYGSSFTGRFRRQKFGVAGRSNAFQVKVSADTTEDFSVRKIVLNFKGVSA